MKVKRKLIIAEVESELSNETLLAMMHQAFRIYDVVVSKIKVKGIRKLERRK